MRVYTHGCTYVLLIVEAFFMVRFLTLNWQDSSRMVLVTNDIPMASKYFVQQQLSLSKVADTLAIHTVMLCCFTFEERYNTFWANFKLHTQSVVIDIVFCM